MLLKQDQSCLLVVDIQEKLIPAIHDHQQLLNQCAWLMRVAQRMNIPVLISEQYPQGLGSTAAILKAAAPSAPVMTKLHFSCSDNPSCASQITDLKRQQIVLIGIEAHVCVLQSAFGLLEMGLDVFVAADCISSRNPDDKALALQRMRAVGVSIISREMALFEWLHQSGTDEFRMMSREFLKNQ